jgi:hypothetical protein
LRLSKVSRKSPLRFPCERVFNLQLCKKDPDDFIVANRLLAHSEDFGIFSYVSYVTANMVVPALQGVPFTALPQQKWWHTT